VRGHREAINGIDVGNVVAKRGKQSSSRAFWWHGAAVLYQGFSLLTANRAVLHNPLIVSLAESANITPAQVVFSFARDIGTLPLTGTSNAEHMKQDLASRDLTLPPEAVQAIESLAG